MAGFDKKSKKDKKKKLDGGSDRRNVWLLVATAFLVVISVALFMPPQEKINQGLDIQGGLSVVLSAEGTDGSAVTSEQMETSRAIIESRVNALGASEAVVQIQGNDQILVQIPGMTDTEAALETIGKTGKLEFARLDSFTDDAVKNQIQMGQYVSGGSVTDEFGNTFVTDDALAYLEVEPGTYTPLITGENVEQVTVQQATQTSTEYAVALRLDSEGTKAFADATAELAPTNGQIVIILDGEVRSAPAVQSEIPNGEVSITGGFDLEEAQSLQTVLESGSLPVSFEYQQSQAVGPTLGQGVLQAGVVVVGLGLLLVLLYLLFFYKGLGLIAAAAMAVFACLYLGILAALSFFGLFSLSLAGLAGIVLTIGMAADSSILTLERFCEEIRMGRSVRAASQSGVKHAIETSIDADLVSLVSALTLFFLASASVKGFGMTLALGIMCDIAMMLLFKAPIIRLLAPGAMAKNPKFWDIKSSQDAAAAVREAAREAGEPVSSSSRSFTMDMARKLKGRFIKVDINFMGARKIFLTVSAVALACTVGVIGVKGIDFGIEFVGGTSIQFSQTGDITLDEMRSAMDAAGEPNAVIQTTETNGQAGFLVRTSTTNAEEASAHAAAAASDLGIAAENFQVSTIGPDWGSSVIKSSVIAFCVSLLLIIAYIAFRFRDYKMGLVAVSTLLHDLLIVIGVYVLVGREVTPNTIAALLTILGYSLYDTVVVFHRISENMKSGEYKCTFMTMANHSVNQVFIRSLNTSITSLVPVIAMLIFGGDTLQDFALAMTVGLAVGVYSSIAIASPLYAMWKTREPRYAKLEKKYGKQVGTFVFGNPQPVDVDK